LLEGIVASGTGALGDGVLTAAIGPGVGACCYEVGEEVAGPFRERFGDDIVVEGRLDLGGGAERALREAGVASVERSSHCTACERELFFSHRRDHGRTGRQGVIASIR
jgi:copper oxidase (laccase) domain-containing protein